MQQIILRLIFFQKKKKSNKTKRTPNEIGTTFNNEFRFIKIFLIQSKFVFPKNILLFGLTREMKKIREIRKISITISSTRIFFTQYLQNTDVLICKPFTERTCYIYL